MPTPTLFAIPSTPTAYAWEVVFYYALVGEDGKRGRTDHTLPSMTVPCVSYEHARAVADAFNNKGEGA